MSDADFIFNITDPPKKGSDNVGLWAWTLYNLSRAWRDEELNMPAIWRENYKLFRGDHWGRNKKSNNLTVNLFFSNVIRTVANITARHPVAEVVDLDGADVSLAKTVTARCKKWWLDSGQPYKLRTTCTNSEIYGITWEKSVWSQRDMQPNVIVCDPFAIFPYPGYWENVATDCPAICHATALDPLVVEKRYETKPGAVNIYETYSLLGGEREEVIGGSSTYGTNRNTSALGEGYTVKPIRSQSTGPKGDNTLVVEVWCRDFSTKPGTEKGEDGKLIQVPVYPGGIRCITICNEGALVLDDVANPNLNFELPEAAILANYFYNRMPFWKNNSYADSCSIFGFSAAEQTAQLNIKIDELVSRLTNFAMRAMTGILVIPPKSGITRAMLNNKPNLVLFPQTVEAAAGIRIVAMPNPPAIIEKVLEMLISMLDRVHAIQDADRGELPGTVTAASAIVALQERNAVLIQHKIDGIDHLIQERGNCAVAQWQMHGHRLETIAVDDTTHEFAGVNLAGIRFNYVVESGSTLPKTSLQIQEQAQALFGVGAIDQQALLENLNFPKWREIVERMGQDQMGAAMQILIQAGMPEDQAQYIMQLLAQNQGGPGNGPQTPPAAGPPATPANATPGGQPMPAPGVPVAAQGAQAP